MEPRRKLDYKPMCRPTGFSMCWDNVQWEAHRNHQNKGAKNDMHIKALAYAVQHRTPSPYLVSSVWSIIINLNNIYIHCLWQIAKLNLGAESDMYMFNIKNTCNYVQCSAVPRQAFNCKSQWFLLNLLSNQSSCALEIHVMKLVFHFWLQWQTPLRAILLLWQPCLIGACIVHVMNIYSLLCCMWAQ